MRQIDKHILSAAKIVYGVERVKARVSVPVGFEIVCAWSLVGYDTLEELEAEYSDDEILEMYYSLNENLRKMAS